LQILSRNSLGGKIGLLLRDILDFLKPHLLENLLLELKSINSPSEISELLFFRILNEYNCKYKKDGNLDVDFMNIVVKKANESGCLEKLEASGFFKLDRSEYRCWFLNLSLFHKEDMELRRLVEKIAIKQYNPASIAGTLFSRFNGQQIQQDIVSPIAVPS